MKLRFVSITLIISMLATTFSFAQNSCPGFKTYTPGGWGASPKGNNPGTFLNNNFAAAFPAPNYLTIGCTNKLQLTSAAAVRAYLPSGTTPVALPPGTKVNPTKTNYNNVFAGQLVALTLNMKFDNNISSFGSSNINLKDLIIATGPFIGKTVQFLADNANLIIGGCPGYFPKSLSEYTTAIDNVNKNYDNGVINGSFLVCPFSISCSTYPVLCKGQSTGSMTISTIGGLAPFTYTWTPNTAAGNIATASNLPAGTYSVTVTDAVGQTATTSCTVTEPATELIASSTHTNVLCHGGSTGQITISFNGGTGIDSVSFNGNAYEVKSTPANYNGLVAGTYNWTVKDANGCSKTGSETITEPDELSVSLSITKDSDCTDGICDGSAKANIVGGTANYNYAWNWSHDGISSSVFVDTSFNNLCPSYYIHLMVTDANGCSASSESTDSVDCIQPIPPFSCAPLKTFTPGGWGASPNGNNAGVYLHTNFTSAFPTGITLGCTNTITWTNAQSVTDWLPSGGTPSGLPSGNNIDNDGSISNTLVGHLLAASLNIGFDSYDADFSTNDGSLGGRYFADGPFAGTTANQVILWANDAIGGCDMHGHTFAEYNDALTNFNENYDNGTQDLGHLICTSSTTKGKFQVDQINTKIFPNPARTEATLNFEGELGQVATIKVYDLTGKLLIIKKISTKNGLNQYRLNVSRLADQNYAVKIITNKQTTTSMIAVQR